MAKEVDEELKDDTIPGHEEIEEQEPPQDIRGAIRAAMDEVNEDTGKNTEDVDAERDEKQRSVRQTKKDKSDSDPDSSKDVQKPDKHSAGSSDRKDDSKEPKDKTASSKEDVKIDPPPFYKNKGKGLWEKLSPEDKQFLVAREKEVSDGFGQVSQRLKSFENLEKAIAPRLPAIQQYGVEPAVVVDRLFQWMEGLNNPQTQLRTFKELAKSFGVNVSQLFPQQTNADGTAIENQPDPNEPPEWFTQTINPLQQEIGSLKNQLSSQQESQLTAYITNWAKDKPHYQKVGPLMAQLIAGGVVPPLANGTFDLDGAYNKAILLDPEIQAQIKQEADEKATLEATQKAEKEAKERTERLAKARKAGASVKPSPRSIPAAPANSKANGKEDTSVRGSIRAALETLRE